MSEASTANPDVEKLKAILDRLENAHSPGVSMISLLVRPGTRIAQIRRMLADELGVSSNIRNERTREIIQAAISLAQERLEKYERIPPNGLALYCGEIVGEDKEAKRFSMDFEPQRPLGTTMYLCDNRFHIDPLREVLQQLQGGD